jgi:hypothetical protein
MIDQKIIGYQAGFFIDEAVGKKNLNGKLKPEMKRCYQNDFRIKLNSSCFEISVFANQPIYSSKDKDGFQLIPKELSSLLGYSKLKIKHVEYFDIRRESKDARLIRDYLLRLG